MGAEAPAARGSRLHQIARRPRHAAPPAGIESCEMCGEPLPAAHRHLLAVGAEGTQQVLCACPACTLLFDHHAAGAGHYRLIPQRRVPLPDFRMDDPLVRRSREARDHWLVGVDDCYRLAARVRASWTGISGGSRVWRQIDAFFGELRGEGPRREEEPWPSPGSASRT